MNDSASMPRTARDALILEMLGDVGRLHDSVESLKNTLPAQVEEAETRIAGLIGLLQKAGDIYQSQIEQYTNAEGEKVKRLLEQQAANVRQQFSEQAHAKTLELLNDANKTIKSTVQAEVVEPARRVLGSVRQSTVRTVALALVCGLMGGAIAVGADYLLKSDSRTNEQQLMTQGGALGRVWEKLDAKTQKMIREEMNNINNSK
jgi:hypothetical protein